MKQVEVTILGQGYILGCPEGGEARLGAAVAAVDREMSAIRDAGKIKARDRIAVLAALNLAYQLAERSERAPSTSGAEPAEQVDGGGAALAGQGAHLAEQAPDFGPLIARLDAALDDGHLI
ncbi:MAG: cell division protein ZapA [Betaproteobacteria bacterium]